MLTRNFLTRAGAAAAVAALLVTTVAPNAAYAKHGNGAGIALGILGGVLAGAAIASSQLGYAASPYSYYYQQPQVYYSPPAYYEPPAAYYYQQPSYYQAAPYGYAGYGSN